MGGFAFVFGFLMLAAGVVLTYAGLGRLSVPLMYAGAIICGCGVIANAIERVCGAKGAKKSESTCAAEKQAKSQ